MDYVREAKGIFSRFGVAYAAFLLVGTIAQVEVTFIAQLIASFSGKTVELNSMLLFLMSMPMYVVGAPISWLLVKDLPTPCRLQENRLPFRQFLIFFCISISVMYIGNYIGLALMSIVNGIQGKPLMNPVNDIVESLDTWMIFILMVVMAPLFEELLYRKLLIDRICQFGDKTAILMSGILFGLSHGNFYQFFYAFGLGVIFAYIYLNTGRLRYTIALHAIVNFMGSIVALYVAENEAVMNVYGVFLLVAMILGIVFLFKFRRRLVMLPAYVEIPKGRRFQTLFLNIGMVLFFLVSLGLFLISGI